MSCTWNPTACSLWVWLLWLNIMNLNFMLWCVSLVYFKCWVVFCGLNTNGCQFVYPFIRWRTFGLFSILGDYDKSDCKHSHPGLCEAICFHFSSVNTQEWNGWVIWSVYIKLQKKLPSCLPKWLYHVAFPSEVVEGSRCIPDSILYCLFLSCLVWILAILMEV